MDAQRTALVIVDPQNDFLSEGGVVWDLVGESVVENDVTNKLRTLIGEAKQAGITVVYSPHYYDKEYNVWEHPNFIDKVIFDRKMFNRGSWGADWKEGLDPDDITVIAAPHKNLSGFHTSDIDIQLRKRGIETMVLAGMSANLCVESHLRDAEERGYEVIVVNDATAAAGPDAYQAALTNFGFIAHQSVTTDEALDLIRSAAAFRVVRRAEIVPTLLTAV